MRELTTARRSHRRGPEGRAGRHRQNRRARRAHRSEHTNAVPLRSTTLLLLLMSRGDSLLLLLLLGCGDSLLVLLPLLLLLSLLGVMTARRRRDRHVPRTKARERVLTVRSRRAARLARRGGVHHRIAAAIVAARGHRAERVVRRAGVAVAPRRHRGRGRVHRVGGHRRTTWCVEAAQAARLQHVDLGVGHVVVDRAGVRRWRPGRHGLRSVGSLDRVDLEGGGREARDRLVKVRVGAELGSLRRRVGRRRLGMRRESARTGHVVRPGVRAVRVRLEGLHLEGFA